MPRSKAQVAEFFAEVQRFLDEHPDDTFTLATRADGDIASIRYTFSPRGSAQIVRWPPQRKTPYNGESTHAELIAAFPRAATKLRALRDQGATILLRERGGKPIGIAVTWSNRNAAIGTVPGMRAGKTYPFPQDTIFYFDA